jgi:hypothetical protein
VLRGLIAVTVAALVATTLAWAGTPSKEKIARTPAGDAQAKAEVLRRADVGAGWKGGFKKPDLSSSNGCSSYHPKQSDLVLIGAAETKFDRQGLELDSEAQVLRTAAMVQRDWQRTVLAPQVMGCLREELKKSLGSNLRLVSIRRVGFPHVTTLTNAFRAVVNVQTQVGPVPIESDFVALGSGRNELTLTLTGPEAARSTLSAMEVRFARVLVARMRPLARPASVQSVRSS